MFSPRSRYSKVCITGASRGIGQALWAELSKESKPVVAIARDGQRLERLSSEYGDRQQKNSYVSQDLSKLNEIQVLVQKLHAEHPDIDLFILNAGYAKAQKIEESPYLDLEYEMLLNYFSPVEFAYQLLQQWKNPVSVLFVSSLSAVLPFPGYANYAASKSALISWFRSAQLELQNSLLDLRICLPGLVKTDLTKGLEHTLIPARSARGVAVEILRAYQHGHDWIVPGLENQILFKSSQAVNQAVDFAVQRLGKKIIPGWKNSNSA